MVLPDDPHVFAFVRRLGDVELLVLGNFSAAATHAAVPDEARWASAEVLLRSGGHAGGEGGDQIILEPWESRVYHRSHS